MVTASFLIFINMFRRPGNCFTVVNKCNLFPMITVSSLSIGGQTNCPYINILSFLLASHSRYLEEQGKDGTVQVVFPRTFS